MLTPKEYHFISQSIIIECQSLINIPELNLISKSYGPYKINEIFTAPLYVALELSKKGHIKLFIPFYLQYEYIESIYEKEKENMEAFQIIHPNFFELQAALIEFQKKESVNITNLINQLRELRLQKIKDGLKTLDGRALILDNLTQYEFSHVKLFIKESMQQLLKMERTQK